MPPADPNGGLVWRRRFAGNLFPEWTVEPDISIMIKIARQELRIPENTVCEIKYLGKGSFNKVYTIQCGDVIEHIFRVSLPVQPGFKTLSEVATMDFVSSYTDIPTPVVHIFDPNNDNELGFEWMIQDFASGRSLHTAWTDMTWHQKELLVRKFVGYSVQLFKIRLPELGNLYAIDEQFCLGQVVSQNFFWGKHVSYDVLRGPFQSSRDWLNAQVQMYLQDAENARNLGSGSDLGDGDDPELLNERRANALEAVKRRGARISALILLAFPEDEQEEFVLHHGDLNTENILVDSNNVLSAIIDWECCPTVPLYLACSRPKFLHSDVDRYTIPNPIHYVNFADGTENITLNRNYDEHVDQYETTRLWNYFLREMQRVCPEWIECYNKGQVRRTLEDIVFQFGMPGSSIEIDRWMDDVEQSIPPAVLERATILTMF
ncbi:kinase-like domain-containing protein [Phaeosphaeriaceae sp. PMI808]|nr:kinase-like domain-containing protein [Phaeosphaeriaceae sp. PMI808]